MVDVLAVATVAAWVGEWVDEMVGRQADKMDSLLAAATVQKLVAPMVGELAPAQVESWDSLMAALVTLRWAARWAERRATCSVGQLAAGTVVDWKAEWSAAAMGACWVADLVYEEAASSVGQSGCAQVASRVAWSAARTGGTEAAG